MTGFALALKLLDEHLEWVHRCAVRLLAREHPKRVSTPLFLYFGIDLFRVHFINSRGTVLPVQSGGENCSRNSHKRKPFVLLKKTVNLIENSKIRCRHDDWVFDVKDHGVC